MESNTKNQNLSTLKFTNFTISNLIVIATTEDINNNSSEAEMNGSSKPVEIISHEVKTNDYHECSVSVKAKTPEEMN